MDKVEKTARTKAALLVLLLFIFGIALTLAVREKNKRDIEETRLSSLSELYYG